MRIHLVLPARQIPLWTKVLYHDCQYTLIRELKISNPFASNRIGFALVNENNNLLQTFSRIEARRGVMLLADTGVIEGIPDDTPLHIEFLSLEAMYNFATKLGISL